MSLSKQYGPPRRPSEYRPLVGINSVPEDATDDAAQNLARYGLEGKVALTPPVAKPAGKAAAEQKDAGDEEAAAGG